MASDNHLPSHISVSYDSFLTSPVPCLTQVSCLKSHVPCLTSHVSFSRLLSHVSYLLSPVSCPGILSQCFLSPFSHLLSLSNAACLTHLPPVSDLLSLVYCLSHVSCLYHVSYLSHISVLCLKSTVCITSHVFLMSPVSCLLSV